ncbi:hypothetical protein ACTD5D_07045 [Nocardia takedensis]|uniref:hypothetical protein n=1 Tax=Nocardia takedensis TaxID=259390 RepID=UPI00031C0769|nr:hypothetical protein [Nocardia takedensis]
MARKRWSDLSPGSRRFIVVATALDSIAKAVALADLRRRPAEQVKGSKRVWATAITVVNSVGVLPLAYFALGRRR